MRTRLTHKPPPAPSSSQSSTSTLTLSPSNTDNNPSSASLAIACRTTLSSRSSSRRISVSITMMMIMMLCTLLLPSIIQPVQAFLECPSCNGCAANNMTCPDACTDCTTITSQCTCQVTCSNTGCPSPYSQDSSPTYTAGCGSGTSTRNCVKNCPTVQSDQCVECVAGRFGSPQCVGICPGGTLQSSGVAIGCCGGNGAFTSGLTASGTCYCNNGYSGVQCQWSRASCGNHGTPNPSTGICTCDIGYTGDTCADCIAPSYYHDTPTTCRYCNAATTCSARGSCSPTGACVCIPNIISDATCSGTTCAINYYNTPSCATYCSAAVTCGYGSCSTSGTCACPSTGFITNCTTCKPNYYGTMCIACPTTPSGVCNNRGTCNSGYDGTGACVCNSGAAGPSCEYTDSVTCHGHGAVTAQGTCASCTVGWDVNSNCGSCLPNYYGSTCTFCIAGAAMCVHGTCLSTGACSCSPGYTGTNCDACAVNYYLSGLSDCVYCLAATTCNNGGTCSTTNGGTCINCITPRTGTYCEICPPGKWGPSCSNCPGYVDGVGSPADACGGSTRGICNSGLFGNGTCTCIPPAAGIRCQAPVITQVTLAQPSISPVVGGLTISVSGQLFISTSLPAAIGNLTFYGFGSPSVCRRSDAPIWLETVIVCTTQFAEPWDMSLGIAGGVSIAVVTNEGASYSSTIVYEAPIITLITPSTNGALTGTPGVTITGRSFGSTNMAVRINNQTLIPSAITSRSNNQLIINMPAGSGIADVQVVLAGQVSNKMSYSYASPIVDVVTSPLYATTGLSTYGGDIVVIRGRNFGSITSKAAALPSVITSNGDSCTIITHNDTTITCITPHGGGNLTGVVRLTLSSFVDAPLVLRYAAPIVINVTGCSGTTSDGAVFGCTMGDTITVNGMNFGPPIQVASLLVAIYPTGSNLLYCLSVSSTIPQIQFTCILPQAAGVNLFMGVSYITPVTGRSLISYVGPHLDPGSIRLGITGAATIIGTILGESRLTGTTTIGGDLITIAGANFGGSFKDIWIPYGAGSDYTLFTYNCTNIALVNSTYLTCLTQPGVGRNFRFAVVVRGLPSRISDDTFSYPAPIINSGTLRVINIDTGIAGAPAIAIDATTTQGDKLMFTGRHFGTVASQLKVTYAANSSGSTLDCSVDAALSNSTHLYCQASPGEGANKLFTVTTAALFDNTYRAIVVGTDVYSYPTTPIITSVTGCPGISGTTGTVGCPTDARINGDGSASIVLTITGQFLPAYPLVMIGARSCENPFNDILAPTSRLTCTLPVGSGLLQPVVISKGSYFSIARDALLVSYALPNIDTVTGCNITVVGLDKQMFCPRTGNIRVTITGSNFGASSAKVIIGGQPCTQVIHAYKNEHRQVTCLLPAGVGNTRGVLLFQLGSEKKGDQSVTISYEPCAAGTIQSPNITTSCQVCPMGSFASKPGQDKCILCSAGSRANATGLTTCTSCVAGTYAATQNAINCLKCPLGSFIGSSGAATCLPCGAGTMSNTLGAIACTSCSPGRAINAANATSCNICSAGTSAVAGQATCLDCSPGTAASHNESNICSPCAKGSYAAYYGMTRCDVCTVGSYSVALSASYCSSCDVGSYAPITNMTTCLECAQGSGAGVLGSSVCALCTPGKFVSERASVECLLCPSGKYSNGNGSAECTPCGTGSFQNTTGQSFCYNADIGQFVASPGQLGQVQCSPGTYSSSSATGTCTGCPVGRYSDTFGASDCIDAPVGRYTQFIGLQTSDACPIGRYSNATKQTVCVQCAAGRSQASAGSISCNICNDGEVSSVGAITCTGCAAGTLANPGHTGCINCIAGTITTGTGRTECSSCSIGTFSRLPARSFCSTCAVGYISNVTASTVCFDCALGRYADAAATSCQDCSPGFYSSKISNQCTACASGTYQSNAGATTCVACPLGSVQSGTGSAICDVCDAGKIMNQEGGRECQPCSVGLIQPNTNSTVCYSCGDGTFSATTGGIECLDCQAGTIGNSVQGQHIRCLSCAAGTFSNSSRATSCYACTAGKSQVDLGKTTCMSCINGRYAATAGLSTCLPCDPGFTSGTGATECSSCIAGFYADGKSSLPQCSACASGTYAPQPRSGACSICSAGRYNPFTNSTSCIFCDPGKFQLLDGQSTCDSCPIGRVAGYLGDTTSPDSACTACVPGTYSNISGQAECTACETGRYQSSAGQSECLPCTSGSYQPLTGQAVCKVCEAGKAQSASGAIDCSPCDDGDAQPLPGQDTCVACIAGRYAVNTILCAACPSGRYSDQSGATECTPCGKGTANALEGETSCQPCRPGFVQTLTEQISCQACDSGSYADASLPDQPCQTCPLGKYMSFTSASACISCSTGRWASTGATSCIKCAAGRFQANETGSGCDACPAGTYQSQDGQSFCVPCAVGEFSSGGGVATCSPCIGPTVAPYVGTASCLVCDEEAVADATHENCICRAGYYAAAVADSGGHLACNICPYGADCQLAGKTLSTIQTMTGFWRAGNDSAMFYRCLLPAHCQAGTGDSDNICLNHRTGILCASCEDGYRSHSGVSKCLECPRAGTSVVITVFFCIAVVLGVLIMYWAVVRVDRDLLEQLKAEDQKNVFWDRIDDEPTDEEQAAKIAAAAALKSQANGKKIVNAAMARGMVTYKIKIMVGFMQIVTNIAVVLDVAWPSYFQSFTSFFSWINLDFVPWQSVGCVSPFTFYSKLIAITITPIGLVFLICVFFLAPLNYMARKKYSAAESEYQVAKQKRIRRVFWKLVLFSLFLLYPGVSSSVLSVFVCRDINGTPYLLADFSVRCYSPDWMQALPLTIIMLLVYPIGVPLFFFHVLYRYRYRRDEPGVRLQVGFLYEAYESSSWWFELCDMAFKLCMTSVLAFLPASLQLQFGMAFCGVFLILLLIRPPYKRKGDFRLHMVALVELLLMCMAGQTIIVQGTYLQPSVDIALSALFIGICVLMFVIFCYIAFANLVKILRAVDWTKVAHSIRTCNCRDICNGSKSSGSSAKLKTQSSSSKLGSPTSSNGGLYDDNGDFGSTTSNPNELEMTTIDTMSPNGLISPLSPTAKSAAWDTSLMAAARRDRTREHANEDNGSGLIDGTTRASSHTVVREMKQGMHMSRNPLFAAAHLDPFGQPLLARAVSGNDTLARALARQPSIGVIPPSDTSASSSSAATSSDTAAAATIAPTPSNLQLRQTDSDDASRIM